jgi:phosphopantothenoylcysteine decarboxylase / phosphopantothenate---cysteine ligase
MACGEWGTGRMAEVDEIAAAAEQILAGGAAKPLHGRHVLVTAGPTFEPIDPVRFIGNRSSGKQGFAIAAAAAQLGARVTLIAGPSALPGPPGVTAIQAGTAREMLTAAEAALPADIAVFAAAVADWRAASVQAEKIKKGASTPQLSLVENPDILKTIAARKKDRPSLIIGFAAETENVIAHAKKKLESKGCDWIVANDVSAAGGVFGGDNNTVHLITRAGVESWPEMTKDGVAQRLMEAAGERLQEAETAGSHETRQRAVPQS